MLNHITVHFLRLFRMRLGSRLDHAILICPYLLLLLFHTCISQRAFVVPNHLLFASFRRANEI